jgi:hypothetical protein
MDVRRLRIKSAHWSTTALLLLTASGRGQTITAMAMNETSYWVTQPESHRPVAAPIKNSPVRVKNSSLHAKNSARIKNSSLRAKNSPTPIKHSQAEIKKSSARIKNPGGRVRNPNTKIAKTPHTLTYRPPAVVQIHAINRNTAILHHTSHSALHSMPHSLPSHHTPAPSYRLHPPEQAATQFTFGPEPEPAVISESDSELSENQPQTPPQNTTQNTHLTLFQPPPGAVTGISEPPPMSTTDIGDTTSNQSGYVPPAPYAYNFYSPPHVVASSNVPLTDQEIPDGNPDINPDPVFDTAPQRTTSSFGQPTPLYGSHDSLLHQNEMADFEGLDRIRNDAELNRMRRDGLLLPLPLNAHLTVDPRLPTNRRYCRPWTAKFLSDISAAFYAHFAQPLQVNSAVRTVAVQEHLERINGNAAPAEGATASPHLTGAAVDISKRTLTEQQVAWMREYLVPVEDAGKIDVEEEFQQAVFHISVYKQYAPLGKAAPHQRAATVADLPGYKDAAN